MGFPAAVMRIRLQSPGHAASLLAELNRCRQTRRYCDVLLQVGNRTFAAHRAVLACAGQYFQNLFTRSPSSSTAAFSLEFISPASFEKVLTFVYTGEILTDLIDVGVLYELAERLGIGELMRACHSTFPDMQNGKSSVPGDVPLNSSLVAAASTVGASVSVSSLCSSAASCSSLSSSAGPSAAPTPAAAPSTLFQAQTSRSSHTETRPLQLKAEDVQSHIGYGELEDHQLTEGHTLTSSSSLSGQSDGILLQGPTLQLKTEQELEDGVAAQGCEHENTDQMISGSSGNSDPAPSNSCSLPDSSAQLGAEACAPTSSSEEPVDSLRVAAVEGGVLNLQRDGRLMFREVAEEGETEEEREALRNNGAIEGTEDEQWRDLAGEIIELSDDENFMEEGEDEEEDEDDLVCLENGNGGTSSGQGNVLSCKACAVPLPADPASIRQHAATHLTDLGLCKLCGASFPDRASGVSHCLSFHVGVQLFTCDMCHLQLCSQNKLLRHHRQAASTYTIPQGALMSSSQGAGAPSELQCAVCTKNLNKDFQTVREHLLTHVCPQSLTCGVCRLPQPSLCSLLWHALSHLALPVFCCPHCARCFSERPLLDRHMAAHAEEASARERSAMRASRAGLDWGAEELQCFLCPQTFRSSSAFQYHLNLHTSESPGSGRGGGAAAAGGGGGVGGGVVPGWFGKRKFDQNVDGVPSSCSSSSSPRDMSGLVKVGLGMSFNLPEKFFQTPMQGLSSGVLGNGCLGPDGAPGSGVRGKWYRCRYCGKRFAHSGEFTYHLRIHTGEKPYQCKVCLRFFRGRSTMICHLKTHAGALMYRCTVCGLFFSTLKLVSSHMELHKDLLPPDFNIEQTFMYNDHSKEPLPTVDA